MPIFYQEVILAYCKANTPVPILSKNCLYNQIIWGNRNFKYKNECLYSRNMIDIGLIYIKDVLKTDRSLKTTIYTDLRNKNTYFKDFIIISKIFKEFKTLINTGNDEIAETNPGIIRTRT